MPKPSDVTKYVVHRAKDEQVRCTREGALALLEAEIVILMDEEQKYQEVIKGRDLLEETIRSGRETARRVLRVRVDSTTDDVERMMAAVSVVTEKNPTCRPPYVLPDDEEGA